MDKSFAKRITAGYDEDPVWRRTAKILVDNEALGKNAATLSFERGQQHSSLPPSLAKKLIFHKDKFTGLRRLCIPQSYLTEIFELLHGKGDHPGFTRSFDLAQRSWSIKINQSTYEPTLNTALSVKHFRLAVISHGEVYNRLIQSRFRDTQ